MIDTFETNHQSSEGYSRPAIQTWLERIPNAERKFDQSTTATKKRRLTGSPLPSPFTERTGISALRKRPRSSNDSEPFTHTTSSKGNYMAEGVFPTVCLSIS